MSKDIEGILLDVNTGSISVKKLDGSLQSFYEALNCDTIDIVERKIAGKPFSIVCDDEGLLKGDPAISAIDAQDRPMLVGSLFIANSEYTPDGVVLSSLSAADKEAIVSASRLAFCGHQLRRILVDVEY